MRWHNLCEFRNATKQYIPRYLRLLATRRKVYSAEVGKHVFSKIAIFYLRLLTPREGLGVHWTWTQDWPTATVHEIMLFTCSWPLAWARIDKICRSSTSWISNSLQEWRRTTSWFCEVPGILTFSAPSSWWPTKPMKSRYSCFLTDESLSHLFRPATA
jgi:hypothetical protein